MAHKLEDNIITCLEDTADRLGHARDSDELAEVVRATAAEIREQINVERLAAAGRLAGWLAHRINNPIGAIAGNAQLLSKRLERDIGDAGSLEIYMRYLREIESQTERCARITGDLLEFTQPDHISLRAVDLAETIAEAVGLACYGRGHPKVSVVRTADGDPPQIRTDGDLLVRALYEIIVNAIQATCDEGSVTISANAAGSQWVRISVADSGLGISEEILPRVFDPFFSTKENARGLGLSTCLTIVRRLGGALTINETGPDGTTVLIELPSGRD